MSMYSILNAKAVRDSLSSCKSFRVNRVTKRVLNVGEKSRVVFKAQGNYVWGRCLSIEQITNELRSVFKEAVVLSFEIEREFESSIVGFEIKFVI